MSKHCCDLSFWMVWMLLAMIPQCMQSAIICPVLAYVSGAAGNAVVGGFVTGYMVQWFFLNILESASSNDKDVVCAVFMCVCIWMVGQFLGTLLLHAASVKRKSIHARFPCTLHRLRIPSHPMLLGVVLGLAMIFPDLLIMYPAWSSPLPKSVPGLVLFAPFLASGLVASYAGAMEVLPSTLPSMNTYKLAALQSEYQTMEAYGNLPEIVEESVSLEVKDFNTLQPLQTEHDTAPRRAD